MNHVAQPWKRKEVIGNATLYLGDCLSILPTLPKVDAVITDPPYGGGYAANPIVGKGKSASNHERMEWDNAPIHGLDVVLHAAPVRIVWGGNYYPLPPSRGWLSWFKPDAPPSMAHFELAWTNLDKNSRQISCSIAETNPERAGHPTQKPIKVMRASIEYAGQCSVIVDPFMGSGTTGVAALSAGRSFIGIEIEPKYFDIACERIENAQRQVRMFA
jgi:site-specific DNA-methyltransferase (adenine-specific)